MIFPNKFIKYEESILNKMFHIVKICEQDKNIPIHVLYKKTESKFSAADEFLYSLDVLYILNVIEVDFVNNIVTYVEGN